MVLGGNNAKAIIHIINFFTTISLPETIGHLGTDLFCHHFGSFVADRHIESNREADLIMIHSLEIGMVGIGRMGWVHARHLLELEREENVCRLAAVVDKDSARLERLAS